LEGEDFDDGFQSEDDQKNVIEFIERFIVNNTLHVPIKSKNKGIEYDAYHDERIKVFVLIDRDTKAT